MPGSILKDVDVNICLQAGLDTILESSYDGIVIADSKGTILYANKAYERLTGISASQIVGKMLQNAVKEGLISRSASLEVLKKKEQVTISEITKCGRNILISASPIFDLKGNIKYVISNCRDLTDLTQLKQKFEEAAKLSEKYVSEIQRLRTQQLQNTDIIANSNEMQKVLATALEVANVDCNVLILGESGVGKDVIAKTIHKYSPRAKGPFIKVNCGAIPDNLLESELFGYEEGAFTGAKANGKPGMFEISNNGTIFLDEIGDLPMNLQVKLLDAIQDKKIKRVGGTQTLNINTRIISATNKNLKQKVADNSFRLDLFYRLNVVTITIPPLRERRDDILPLALHFLNKFNKKYNKNAQLSPVFINFLNEYSYPGNIRELENIVERFVITNEMEFKTLYPDKIDTPQIVTDRINNSQIATENYFELIRDPVKEKDKILELYCKYKSTRKVAAIMGLSQSTIVRRLKKYKNNG